MFSYWNKSSFKKCSTKKFGLSDLTVLIIVILNISIKEVNCQGKKKFKKKIMAGQNLNWLKTPNNFQFDCKEKKNLNRLDANC